MSILVGTSGYSHSEWKGYFYPEKYPQKGMLGYYAQRFHTVELNFTFRQLPIPKVVDGWADKVPDAFRFVLKGKQSITHFNRLLNVESDVDEFIATVAGLKDKLGPILFQLPPTFKKNVERLDAFLKHIGGRANAAFEFRDASWLDDEVYACLRSHSAALAITDRDDMPETGLVHTANWGYLRMWASSYTDGQQHRLLADIRSHKWSETFVIFTHMEQGISAALAIRFQQIAAAGCLEKQPVGWYHIGMPATNLTSDEAWRAIFSLGHDAGEKIDTVILAELIGMGFIRNGNDGPELTSKGWAAHKVAESGKDDRVEELDSLPIAQ